MALVLNTDQTDSCMNSYREVFSDPLKSGDNYSYNSSVILPLDFSLEMDGLSGIIPHSAFTIPSDSLPKSYIVQSGTDKGKQKVAFILHTIEQNVDNNKWTTKISGQTLNIRFEPLTEEEKKAIQDAKTKQESLANYRYVTNTSGNRSNSNKVEENFTPTPGCTKGALQLLSKPTSLTNIAIIKKALKDWGITGQNAVAAIIAICGGESGLVPQNEGYIYSKERIKQIFTGLTTDQITRATRKGITREEFFRIVYGEYNPKRIGNRNVTDGGLYYGRGFNQLTGYGNYKEKGEMLNKKYNTTKYDLVKNPELANDVDTAAKLLGAYYDKNMKGRDQNQDSYYVRALKITGKNSPDIKAKKDAYYNCLMSDKKSLLT